MSLDISLYLNNTKSPTGSGIFTREDGQTKEISQAEWDEKFPGRQPIIVESEEDGEVYWRNITHNLNTMAGQAGIYKHLWRPDEIGISEAGDLIVPLQVGLDLLESDPDYFKAFNPENGWGDYNGLVDFVIDYLEACKKYPQAKISISR